MSVSILEESDVIRHPTKALPAIRVEKRREARERKREVVIDLEVPEIFLPLLKPARYKGAYGGRGSAKSWFFAGQGIQKCLTKRGTKGICIREVQRSLEHSVKRLLADRISAMGVSPYFKVLNTHIKTPGDGVIIFQGMQDHTSDSIKSLEGFDWAFVEEAHSMSRRSLDLLLPTLRKEDSEYWFGWNPRRPTDPVDDFFRNDPPPDAVSIESSYKDNPFFPEVLRTKMEWDKRRDPDKYSHIWLGEYERHTEARVFKNYTVEEFDTPEDAEFLFGGDFGFANDPTVLSRSYVKGRTLFIDYEAYAIGCEIDDTPDLFDSVGCTKNHLHAKPGSKCTGMARKWEVIADSARPETISYLQRHGYPRIEAARKGPGSVEEGINFLKNFDIVIHTRCVNTIDEFASYCYKRHPLTEEIMPVLDDKKNHVIDATRYAVEKLNKPVMDNSLVW